MEESGPATKMEIMTKENRSEIICCELTILFEKLEKTIIPQKIQYLLSEFLKLMDLGSENFKLSSEEKDLSKVQENSLIILRNFEKIYKLSKRWTFNGLFLLGHMYHKLLTTTCLIDIANSLVPTLFKFLNNLLQLHEKLKNIQIGDPLLTAGREMLAQLLKRDDLEKSQIIEIQLLLATLKPKYSLAYTTSSERIKELLQEAKNKDSNGKLYVILELMDLLGDARTYQEQIEIFGLKVVELLKDLCLTDYEGKAQVLLGLLKLINNMIFDTQYFIDINKIEQEEEELEEEEKEEMDAIHREWEVKEEIKEGSHTLYEIGPSRKILENSSYILKPTKIVINHCLVEETNIEIQMFLLNILKRLYKIFPHYRNETNPMLVQVLVNIAKHHRTEENLQAGSNILHWINREGIDKEFKQELQIEPGLKPYYESEYYQSLPQPKEYMCHSFYNINTLNLLIGFPLTEIITPGGIFNQFIQDYGHFGIYTQLLFCGFATQHNDIEFSISRVIYTKEILKKANMEEEEEVVTYKDKFKQIAPVQKFQSDINPVKCCYLVKKPGIYKLLWSNEHSWFKTKKLRYRVQVLNLVSFTQLLHENFQGGTANDSNNAPQKYTQLQHIVPDVPVFDLHEEISNKILEIEKGEKVYTHIYHLIILIGNNSIYICDLEQRDYLYEFKEQEEISTQIFDLAIKQFFARYSEIVISTARVKMIISGSKHFELNHEFSSIDESIIAQEFPNPKHRILYRRYGIAFDNIQTIKTLNIDAYLLYTTDIGLIQFDQVQYEISNLNIVIDIDDSGISSSQILNNSSISKDEEIQGNIANLINLNSGTDQIASLGTQVKQIIRSLAIVIYNIYIINMKIQVHIYYSGKQKMIHFQEELLDHLRQISLRTGQEEKMFNIQVFEKNKVIAQLMHQNISFFIDNK